MLITEKRSKPELIVVNSSDIQDGAVFTGTIQGQEGPWYTTPISIVNLRSPGLSFTNPNGRCHLTVYNYERRDAELILR